MLWEKIELFLYLALVIELSVSAILSIKFLDQLLQSTLTKSIKNLLVILISFGVVWNMKNLRLFAGSTIEVSHAIDFLLSALFLARLANILHDLFALLKERAKRDL
ncbi:MAG: hypothetical protein KDK38_04540 [Leptospiraceae bacterium]|nr:hypothetical protein [Leptospiraceae bacterium]